MKNSDNIFREEIYKELDSNKSEIINLNDQIEKLTIANEKYLNKINELSEEIGKNDIRLSTGQSHSFNDENIEIEMIKDELKEKNTKIIQIREEMVNYKIKADE
jgi:hypothetical protein